MQEIIALFAVFIPHLSTTTGRQLSRIVFAVLAMTGRVTMLNISRWTSKGGSYRTLQRFFNTVLPWPTLFWVFFRTHLLDRESEFIIAGDETIKPKTGLKTFGLDRFFSSTHGKAIPSLSFLAVSLVSVNERRSYPMAIEQIVRDDTSSASASKQDATPKEPLKRPRGRPKGSKNRDKTDVVIIGVLKQLQTMIKGLLAKVGGSIQLRYLVLDGYFGHNNALQMTRQCDLHLISKLRSDAALFWQPTDEKEGPGRPQLYGERFNPQQIDPKYRISIQTDGNIRTEIYQGHMRNRKFPELLNIVCLLKTNLKTKRQSHILLFSSDLALDAEKMIDYYSLRFQIEFNFRDAKQYWGLQDAMNVNEIPVNTAANLSMFMVNVSAKLIKTFRGERTLYSVIDLKSHYRGLKYKDEILKMLPQKPEPIVIEKITEHLGSIGAIHWTQTDLSPG